MIAYIDTSVFVPLLVEEVTTPDSRLLWECADKLVATRLTFVEASSAIARAHRGGRLDDEGYKEAVAKRDVAWRAFDVIELDELLMWRSSALAKEFGLRGYDAVHCAAAELADEPDLVASSNDAALVAAWRALGLTTM